jgi:hypothetical protein
MMVFAVVIGAAAQCRNSDAIPSKFGIGRLAHCFDLNQSASAEPPDRYVACLGNADDMRGPARNNLQPMHHNLI